MPRSILVVEDNPITLKMLRVALETEKFVVHEAHNGSTALKLLATVPVDMILQDFVLPDMSGGDLVQAIRATPSGRDLPVLLLTGLSSIGNAGDLFTAVLRKPIEPSRLVAVVHELFASRETPAAPSTRRVVLVVDDDPINRKLAQVQLGHAGYSTVAVGSADEAMAEARRNRPDIILADVLMPVLDGFQLCAAVRGDPALRDLPIVLVSAAYAETEDRELALQVGASDLVFRSPGLTQEMAAISRALDATAPPVAGGTALDLKYVARLRRQVDRQLAANQTLAERGAIQAAALSMIGALTQALANPRDVSAVLGDVLVHCLDAAGLSTGLLYEIEADDRLRLKSASGLGRVSRGEAEAAFNHPELLVPSATDQPLRAFSEANVSDPAEREFLRRCKARSVLIIPFVVVGRHYGTLVLASDTHDLSETQWRTFGRALATQFGQAMALGQAIVSGADSEDLFQTACRVAPSGMLIVDPGGAITLANEQIESIFGYRQSEMVGRPVEMLLPDRLRTVHRGERAGFLARPESRSMGVGRELFGRHKDGREIPIEVGLAPIVRQNGTSVLASVIDITQRKRAERELSATAARLRGLMESAGDGISVLSDRGVVVDTNQRMADLLGLAISEVRGRPIAELSSGENYEAKVLAFAETVSRGGGQILDVEIVRPDGTTVTVDFSLSLVEADGEHLVFAIGRDVTQQRLVERQLTQAQRMEAVGRLAGGVAHDFNNVLSAIFGYVELALDGLPEASDVREDLREVRKAAERAAGLTRQLLAFSRQQVMEARVINLNDVVHNVERMLRQVLGEDIEFRTVLGTTVDNIRADVGQVEQVLMNLIVNARDAMPLGGQLTIETMNVELTEEYADDHQPVLPGIYVMLAVSDTGHGMTRDVLAHVFDPFFTTKPIDKGTGLGLSTVYGIVKQSGGYVWAYSEPGQGTAFKIYLPSVDAAVQDTRGVPASGRLNGTETILVAEDEASLRRLKQEILGNLGYTVLVAANADEALELAARHTGEIHLLITDVVMPGKSGRELAQLITEARPATKVLFVSGYTDDTVVRHGILNSGVEFLQKPYTPATLGMKVRQVLDSHR